jgi:uncharacterized protein YciI
MALWVRTLLVTGPVEEVDAAWPDHLARLRELSAEGRLRVVGEIDEREGLIEVFEAVDRLAAEAYARTGALVERGLAAWTLRRWSDVELG